MVGALFVTEMNGTKRQCKLQIDDYPDCFSLKKQSDRTWLIENHNTSGNPSVLGGFFYHKGEYYERKSSF
jgi:hypothetical protein